MSANEINTDKSAETPATAVQNTAAPEKPAAPQQVSRLFARYRRDKAGGTTQTPSPLSSDPVTSADNLPVRATAPAHLVGDSDQRSDDRFERPERRDRGDRPDRGDRRDRPDRGDRGHGRRDQGRQYDRAENRRESPDPAHVTETRQGEEAPARVQSTERPDTEAKTDTAPSEQRPRRRGPRFEETGDQSSDRSHLIQEFKPSRHAKPAGHQDSKKGTEEKKGSLMGWIKSVFTGGDEATETPAAPPSRNRQPGNRGPRPQSNAGNRDGAPRRRRRGRRSGSGGGGGGQNRGRRGGDNRPRRGD